MKSPWEGGNQETGTLALLVLLTEQMYSRDIIGLLIPLNYLLNERAGEDDLRVQRRGSGGGLECSRKVRFLCSLKDEEGQGPSRFGVSSRHRARESLGLPPCSAC